ncbi:MAG: aldose 1-epimerase [Spirochaetota bacterium]
MHDTNSSYTSRSFTKQQLIREAKILSVGNTLYSFRYQGKEIFHFPSKPDEYQQIRGIYGNPFLYPFANRLQDAAFRFQGVTYKLPENFAYFTDGNGLVLHGTFLKEDSWQVLQADEMVHRVKFSYSKDSEQFTRFPFAHEVYMQHEFSENSVLITVEVKNQDSKDMPVSFGFHPYFSLEGTAREKAKLLFPVKSYFVADDNLLPTGELKAVEKTWQEFPEFLLKEKSFDHVFTDLVRDKEGWSHFALERSDGLRVQVSMDRGYQAAVLFTPRDKPFVCIEPMVGPTNAINLFEDKKWQGLPIVQPGKSYFASFRIHVENVK